MRKEKLILTIGVFGHNAIRFQWLWFANSILSNNTEEILCSFFQILDTIGSDVWFYYGHRRPGYLPSLSHFQNVVCDWCASIIGWWAPSEGNRCSLDVCKLNGTFWWWWFFWRKSTSILWDFVITNHWIFIKDILLFSP